MSEELKPVVPFVRWHVVIAYKAKAGDLHVPHDIREISELHAIVEHGPHWGSIASIVITPHPSYDGERGTIEELSLL